MSESADPGVREGEVLAGKYRVDRVLGVGGMGVVVAAHHIQLDEKVAIKFLLPAALKNAQAVARFEREARAAVKIKSEHVARVTDVGQLENGAPYMVMEYLDGGDLGDWLEQRGALPIEQAVEFVLQACEAIAEAHAIGIVHRDLKPTNLFCIRRRDGLLSVKVLDFGISKVTASGDSGAGMALTTTQAVMGSPYYMSPEQMSSARDVDARTDIWALGVVLFQLVTGEVPFTGDALPELVLKIAGEEPLSLRALRPDAPAELEAVVRRCLEKNRAKRYQNVAELALALAPFAPKHARVSVERASRVISTAGLSSASLVLPPSTEDVIPAGTPASTVDPTAISLEETAPIVPKRSLVPYAAIGAVVLVGLAGVAFFASRGPSSPTEASAAAASQPSAALLPVPEPSVAQPVEPPLPAEWSSGAPPAPPPSAKPDTKPRVVPITKSTASSKPASATAKPATKPPAAPVPPPPPAPPKGVGGSDSLGGRM